MKSAFMVFKSSEAAKQASLRYSDTPFSYVMDDAQKGEKDALFFFVLQSLNPIAKAFIKYGTMGRDFQKGEINEKSHDFFNTFISYLYDITLKQQGPFFRFDREIFVTSQDDSFILNKFRYYMYSYAGRVAKAMFKEENEIENSEIGEEGYNAIHPDKKSSAFEELPDIREPPLEENPILHNHAFMEYLKQHGKKGKAYYNTLVMLSQGKTMKEISEVMGLNLGRNYSGLWMRIDSIKKLYQKFMATQKGE